MKTAKNNDKDSRQNPPKANASFYPAHILMKSHYVDTAAEVTNAHIPVPFHSHDFYEVIYFKNSIGVEYLIGSERYRVQKGDIVMTAPGVAHCPLLPENMTEPYLRDTLRISEEFIALVTADYLASNFAEAPDSFLLRTAGTRWEFLGELFRQSVAESEEQQPGWELVLLGKTMQLLVHLHRATLERAIAPAKAETPELVDRVLEYIEAHLHEKITLSDVAHHFYVSQSTITQTFRNKLGLSFYRCVTQRRLVAAKRLIEGDAALESIAEAVGFTDYSAFYRAFKQEFGISPRQYRVCHSSGK